MGQQVNLQDKDRDERYGEEMAQRTAEQDEELADTAMGTGNDDPIENWSDTGTSGLTDAGAGGSVTSGNNDATDEIGAPTDINDSSAGNEEGYHEDEPHHQGAGQRTTSLSEGPRNSE